MAGACERITQMCIFCNNFVVSGEQSVILKGFGTDARLKAESPVIVESSVSGTEH